MTKGVNGNSLLGCKKINKFKEVANIHVTSKTNFLLAPITGMEIFEWKCI